MVRLRLSLFKQAKYEEQNDSADESRDDVAEKTSYVDTDEAEKPTTEEASEDPDQDGAQETHFYALYNQVSQEACNTADNYPGNHFCESHDHLL